MSSHSRTGASLLSAVLALVAFVSHAGTNSWTTKGPPGGHALDLKAHSTAPNVFYAMFLRSIHRSTDGGVTWTVLRNFEGQVNGLAVDPSDGDRLYVSVYNEGLYRSQNRGDSFSIVAPPGSGIWGVAANATTVYYSSADRQIHRSVVTIGPSAAALNRSCPRSSSIRKTRSRFTGSTAPTRSPAPMAARPGRRCR